MSVIEKLCFLFLFTTFFSFAFGQTSPDWKKLDQPAYSLEYPTNWLADQTGLMETELLLMAPKSSEADKFQENINLVSQNIAEFGLDLDGYVQLCFAQLRQLVTNFHVISMDKGKSGNDTFYNLVYLADQDALHLQLEQHYFVKNNQVYILTFTCETKEWEAYKSKKEKIMASFSLK